MYIEREDEKKNVDRGGWTGREKREIKGNIKKRIRQTQRLKGQIVRGYLPPIQVIYT